MSDYNYFISNLTKLGKVDKRSLEKMSNIIALQESRGDPKAVQQLSGGGTGAGRGLFQYELDKSRYGGKTSQATITAGNRLKNFYKNNKLEAPDWVKELPKSFDPTELSAEQQKMLFFADSYYKNKGDLSEWGAKDFNALKWWADKHKGVGLKNISAAEENRFKSLIKKAAMDENTRYAAADTGTMTDVSPQDFAQPDDPFIRQLIQQAERDTGVYKTIPYSPAEQPMDTTLPMPQQPDTGLDNSLLDWMMPWRR